MEDNDSILTFDTLYTTNEIQILKLALPLLSASLRPFAALIIKGKELKYCFEQLPKGKIENASLELHYLDTFLESALPYCNARQRELFFQLKNIRKTLDMVEQMKSLMTLFGEDDLSDLGGMLRFFDSATTQKNAESFSAEKTDRVENSFLNQFIQSSLSGEQAEMFEKFKRQFETEKKE